jgi:hypothetical protein
MADLFTRAAFKTAFGVLGTDLDAAIDAMLPQITAEVCGICERVFEQATVTEYPAPLSNYATILPVDQPPIASITSLHWSTAIPRVYDATTLLINGTDYLISSDSQWIELVSPRSYGTSPTRVAKVVYVGGYATIPLDLVRAAQELLAVKLYKATGKIYHFLGVTTADGSMQGVRFDDLTPDAERTFERYRLRSIA